MKSFTTTVFWVAFFKDGEIRHLEGTAYADFSEAQEKASELGNGYDVVEQEIVVNYH